MALEIADIQVRSGTEEDFLAAYGAARELLVTMPGCRSARMTRGVESPSRFVLLVEWDSVDAHDNFRASPHFAAWREAIGPYFAAPPHVEHVRDV